MNFLRLNTKAILPCRKHSPSIKFTHGKRSLPQESHNASQLTQNSSKSTEGQSAKSSFPPGHPAHASAKFYSSVKEMPSHLQKRKPISLAEQRLIEMGGAEWYESPAERKLKASPKK
eukprot:TRINITY_DN2446_c0_g1_i1.p1 TRINITY_DN2446_c0_g1~~TRINITY_DN2446_c0_g1_i1.p1  ORF type:complete len:117 (+),score=40.72 TRINITY_DN2446_c0_g1_i1:92-442(+)